MSEKALLGKWFGAAVGALCAWLLCASFMLIVFSAIFALDLIPLACMGYAGSAISFLSALAASSSVAAKLKGGRLSAGIVGALVLSALLTLCGFLAGKLDPGAVLSAGSFSIAGFLVGAILPVRKKRKVIKRK